MIITLLDIILLVGIFIFIHKFKVKTIDITNNYLSIDNTTILKGLLSITIIFHHVSQKIQYEDVIFQQFSIIGYLIVSVFLFLSGYGVTKSFIDKGDLYIDNFWRKRILYILLIYIIITFIYYLYRLMNNEFLSVKYVLYSFVNGQPLADYSWYIIIQIILYVIWWFSFKICKNTNNSIFICGEGIVILNTILIYFNYPFYIWSSNLSFFLGGFWALYKTSLDKYITKKIQDLLCGYDDSINYIIYNTTYFELFTFKNDIIIRICKNSCFYLLLCNCNIFTDEN